MSDKLQKVLFLDRDGTISYDDGAFGSEEFPYDEVIKKTRPIEGVKENLKIAKDKGFMLIVISNQAGIAKGRFGECDTHLSNKLLQDKLDGLIDGFYYCPHHTTGKNNCGQISKNARLDLIYKCECRKPKIGLFLQCEQDLLNGKIQYIDDNIINRKIQYLENRDRIFKKDIEPTMIDKKNSYMIGDKWIDVLAGERYGVNSIFVMTGEGEVEFKQKKDKQEVLPQNFEVFDSINDFIKERI